METVIPPRLTVRPLSILMVDSHATIERGGAVQCALLARGLAERGHRVTCVFDVSEGATATSEPLQRLAHAGVAIKCFRLGRISSMLTFRRYLAAHPPDIIHTHKNRALRFVFGVTLGWSRPPWIANRGTEYSLKKDWVAYVIHRRSVDRIVAVSHAVRSALIRDGIDPDKVNVIYGSYDPQRFHPGIDGARMRERWIIPKDAPLIGLVASLTSKKKGHSTFLQAARHVLNSSPTSRFVLVGEGDPAKLRDEATRLRLETQLIFAGFLDNVSEALAAMDIVVCASLRGEGLTGSIREALAMERPVISTDVAGNKEIVRHQETGLLVPPGNPKDLAEAMLYLLRHPEEAHGLAARGRASVETLCTHEKRVTGIERLYAQLVEERTLVSQTTENRRGHNV